jgi:hypothetical protein
VSGRSAARRCPTMGETTVTDDQLPLAFADRHAGQEANLAAAETGHRDDRARVEHAVALLAKSGGAFTADHVHDLLFEGDPYDRNLVSSVLGVWSARGGVVEVLDRRPVPSRSRSRRASRNRWWVGAAHAHRQTA